MLVQQKKTVNKDLKSTATWLNQSGLIRNHKKCECLLIGSKHAAKNTQMLQIILNGKPVKQSDNFKYLRIFLDHCLTWSKRVAYIQSRVYPKLKLLNRISSFLCRNILLRIYNQTALPLLDYGCVVWGECSKENARLEHLQNQAMQIILHADKKTCTREMRAKLKLFINVECRAITILQ